MKRKKNLSVIRISNRRYPVRQCKKPDCQADFVPTDSRQIYCSQQHRIDFNNDKRKEKEAITVLFLNKVKSNEAILKKVKTSNYYSNHKCVKKSLLDYEGYDFNFYHQIIINELTLNEAHVCFDFILELIDPTAQLYTILQKSKDEI